jgi:asparagine synthase (glutamine-hydrolysing)
MPSGMRGKNRLRLLLSDPALRCTQSTTTFHNYARSLMYSDDYYGHVRNHDPLERLVGEYRAASHLDVTTQMQRVDSRAYLVDDILVKVDKASMMNSLETRAPLLDQCLAEYVSSLPSTLRMRNGVLKYLLKKFAADLLPAEILARPKMGFGVPLEQWFRTDLNGYAYDLLTSSQANQRGIFDPRFVQDLLKAHRSTKAVNYGEAIWALLCLEQWFRTFMDDPATSPQSDATAPQACT